MYGGVGAAVSNGRGYPITLVMACELWGESPLDENEDPEEGSIPAVTPIDKVLDEGNCGEVTNRGKEACECAGKPTENRRRPHSRQCCEATDRNLRAPTHSVGLAGADRRASQPSRSRLRSSALVNWELVQRKPHVLSREIRRTYLQRRLACRQSRHRSTVPVCSGSQQRP
jgi:hypothetical protein